jgi:tetratricopeptide (TPR) repeat protein
VVQRLVVHLTAEPGRHRLDRLTPSLQHQPAQVALASGTLVGARQRREHLGGECLQASTDGSQLGRCDASQQLPSACTEGGSTHTPPARRKPDRALLGTLLRLQVEDHARARVALEESLELHRRLGELEGAAVALDGLGILALAEGNYEQAASLLEEALAMARKVGHVLEVADCMADLAVVALYEAIGRAREGYSTRAVRSPSKQRTTF